MGNEQSSENGCPSLTGPEAVLVDPSTILGETQQEISMRTQLGAQSSTPNTHSVTPSTRQAIHLLLSSSIEPDSALHISDGADRQE